MRLWYDKVRFVVDGQLKAVAFGSVFFKMIQCIIETFYNGPALNMV